MSNRLKIFLISGIIILALVALVEGFFLLRQSGVESNLSLVFDRALAPLRGSKTDPSQSKNQFKAQEDLILQETAEDLDNMQDQINRLFYEMTRNMQVARQNIDRQEIFNRNPFHPQDSLERLHSEIAHIFQRAHESRHRGALELIEQDWRNVDKISSMNIEEEGTNYVITVSMPGFERTDIAVSLNGRILTVEAASERQRNAQDSRTIRTGCFKTQIMMPGDIGGEAAKASYENDLLKITIPRKETGNSLARKVTIM